MKRPSLNSKLPRSGGFPLLAQCRSALTQQELAEKAMDARETIRTHDDNQAVQEAEPLLAVLKDYIKMLEG